MAFIEPAAGERVTPSEAEVAQARRALPRLRRRNPARLQLELESDGKTERLQLPKAAKTLLVEVLRCMASGRSVRVIPEKDELTTQEAADILGVSRPFIVAQMDGGMIPFRKVGTHRRVASSDLLKYERRMRASRRKALKELAAEGQRLGLEL